MEPMDRREAEQATTAALGTKDGRGAGDHDAPYRFGHRPSARWTYPFLPTEYGRLLILRGRVQNGDFAADQSV